MNQVREIDAASLQATNSIQLNSADAKSQRKKRKYFHAEEINDELDIALSEFNTKFPPVIVHDRSKAEHRDAEKNKRQFTRWGAFDFTTDDSSLVSALHRLFSIDRNGRRSDVNDLD